MVLGKLMRSAIEDISLKADMRERSELLMVRLFWYLGAPKASKDADPVPGPIMVDKSPPLSSGFSGPPTRLGSTPLFSLLKVRHSEPTSITRSPTTRPHSEQIISPAL